MFLGYRNYLWKWYQAKFMRFDSLPYHYYFFSNMFIVWNEICSVQSQSCVESFGKIEYKYTILVTEHGPVTIGIFFVLAIIYRKHCTRHCGLVKSIWSVSLFDYRSNDLISIQFTARVKQQSARAICISSCVWKTNAWHSLLRNKMWNGRVFCTMFFNKEVQLLRTLVHKHVKWNVHCAVVSIGSWESNIRMLRCSWIPWKIEHE